MLFKNKKRDHSSLIIKFLPELMFGGIGLDSYILARSLFLERQWVFMRCKVGVIYAIRFGYDAEMDPESYSDLVPRDHPIPTTFFYHTPCL